MTITHAIGYGSNKVIRLIVRGLALSRIHPNVLTFLGLVINMVAAYLLALGQFRWGAAVITAGPPQRAVSNARPARVATAPGRNRPAVPSPGVAGSANQAYRCT